MFAQDEIIIQGRHPAMKANNASSCSFYSIMPSHFFSPSLMEKGFIWRTCNFRQLECSYIAFLSGQRLKGTWKFWQLRHSYVSFSALNKDWRKSAISNHWGMHTYIIPA